MYGRSSGVEGGQKAYRTCTFYISHSIGLLCADESFSRSLFTVRVRSTYGHHTDMCDLRTHIRVHKYVRTNVTRKMDERKREVSKVCKIKGVYMYTDRKMHHARQGLSEKHLLFGVVSRGSLGCKNFL